jgi:hypothetical protein
MMRLHMCKFIMVFIVFIVGCGAEQKDKKGSESISVNGGTPTVEKNSSSKSALLVNSETDIPTCGTDNSGQLIYVKTLNRFKHCSSQSWQEIDLRGPQGEKGLKGDIGAKGEKGDIGPQGPTGNTGPQGPVGATGAQGTQGPAGSAGLAGINCYDNISDQNGDGIKNTEDCLIASAGTIFWTDPFTTKKWYYVGVDMNWNAASTACESGWGLPTRAQLVLALKHRLFISIVGSKPPNPSYAWTSDISDASYSYWVRITDLLQDVGINTQVNMVFCISQ